MGLSTLFTIYMESQLLPFISQKYFNRIPVKELKYYLQRKVLVRGGGGRGGEVNNDASWPVVTAIAIQKTILLIGIPQNCWPYF